MKRLWILTLALAMYAGTASAQYCPPLCPNPVYPADFPGRSLNVPVFGVLGHSAIYDGSGYVWEAMGPPGASPSVLHDTWASFRAAGTYYGYARYNPLPNGTVYNQCWASVCYISNTYPNRNMRDAVMQRILQIQALGNSYTLSPFPTFALPLVIGPLGTWTFGRSGSYRCDSLIVDVMNVGYYDYTNTWVSSWRPSNFVLATTPLSYIPTIGKIQNLGSTMTPVQLLETINQWPLTCKVYWGTPQYDQCVSGL
jgi:hypothetical protein